MSAVHRYQQGGSATARASLWTPARLRRLDGLLAPAWKLIHWILCSRVAVPLRLWLCHRFHRQLMQLDGMAGKTFYLAQIPDARFRAGAARAPVLHYWLLGRYLELSLVPGFHVRSYRLAHPEIPRGTDPLLHALDAGALPNPAARASKPHGIPHRAALLIDHGRGGGSTRFLQIYEQRLRSEGYALVHARRAGGPAPLLVVEPSQGPVRWINPFEDEDGFAVLVRELGVMHCVVNHVIDLPQVIFSWLPRFAVQQGVTYEVLLHDYYLVCPRVNLVDASRRYCGIAAASECRTCLAKGRPRLAGIDPLQWREDARALLAGAARVVAPGLDLAQRLVPFFPDIAIEVYEPEHDTQLIPERRLRIGCDEPLRLLVIGALNLPKGYDVLLALARIAAAHRAPVRFTLLGSSEHDTRLRAAGVRVHGRYREADLGALIADSGAHAAFFPAIWPETWSFTLSAALHAGLPVIAFDHGAIAQRLRRMQRGTLLPTRLSDDPDALLRAMMQFRTDRCGSVPTAAVDAAEVCDVASHV